MVLVIVLAVQGCTAIAIESVQPEVCLNQTETVVPFIRTSSTVHAISSVVAAQESCSKDYTWDGVMCVKSIITESYCNDNYELIDGSCQIIEEAECPAGFHKSDTGDCKLRVEFEVKCPPEHEWNGENCVKSVAGVCQVGTEMEDGICVHTATAQAECPPNFELVGTQCRQRVDTICDDDYELINGECVLVERQPVVYKCPDDMRLEGKQCVSRVQSCPEGYQLNGTNCINVTISCPPNSKLDANNQCVQIICNPVPAKCLDGYELINGKCYEIRTPTCEEGKVLVNRTVCVLPCEVFEAVCPAGTHLDNGWCVGLDISQPVRPFCSDGYSLQNNWCVKLVSNPRCQVVNPRCQPGYVLLNNECVKKIISCPNGFQLFNNTCLQEVCPTGSVWNGNSCVIVSTPIESECLPGFVMLQGECVPEVTTRPPNVNAQCPDGYVLRDGLCYHTTIIGGPDQPIINVNVKPTCDNGYVLIGAWCVPRNNTTPLPTCPEGYYIRNGTCHQNGIAPYCPPKYVLVNNECVCTTNGSRPSIPSKDPLPVNCPADRPVLMPNGTCVWIDVITKPPTCPEGYVFHRNGTCQAVIVSCPAGQILLANGTCYTQARCPAGYTFQSSSGQCIRIIPSNCPFGFEFGPGRQCYPIRPVCRDGFQYRDGACYPIIQTPSQPTYPFPNPSPDHKVTCKIDGGLACTNQITNTVVIDKPVNVVTTNENNVYVHLYENGKLVKITRNNDTQVIPIANDDRITLEDNASTAATTDAEEISEKTETPTCCLVVSPRKCTKVGDEWQCTQRQTQRCGWFCTRSTIYLKPRRTIYRRPVLVMRPPPSWYRYANWGQSQTGRIPIGTYFDICICLHYIYII